MYIAQRIIFRSHHIICDQRTLYFITQDVIYHNELGVKFHCFDMEFYNNFAL